MPPAFLDIVAAFALFRRSAINLTIYRDFDSYHIKPLFIVRIHTIAFALLHIVATFG